MNFRRSNINRLRNPSCGCGTQMLRDGRLFYCPACGVSRALTVEEQERLKLDLAVGILEKLAAYEGTVQ